MTTLRSPLIKITAAITGTCAAITSVATILIYLELAPVLAKDFKKSNRQTLELILPRIYTEQRELKITRGQLRLLPQSRSTIQDIEAVDQRLYLNQKQIDQIEKRLENLQ